jgi:hypothetical protein
LETRKIKRRRRKRREYGEEESRRKVSYARASWGAIYCALTGVIKAAARNVG